jgi:hypothetical protein
MHRTAAPKQHEATERATRFRTHILVQGLAWPTVLLGPAGPFVREPHPLATECQRGYLCVRTKKPHGQS